MRHTSLHTCVPSDDLVPNIITSKCFLACDWSSRSETTPLLGALPGQPSAPSTTSSKHHQLQIRLSATWHAFLI